MIKVYKNDELYSTHTQLVDAQRQVKFALEAGALLEEFKIGDGGEYEYKDPDIIEEIEGEEQ